MGARPPRRPGWRPVGVSLLIVAILAGAAGCGADDNPTEAVASTDGVAGSGSSRLNGSSAPSAGRGAGIGPASKQDACRFDLATLYRDTGVSWKLTVASFPPDHPLVSCRYTQQGRSESRIDILASDVRGLSYDPVAKFDKAIDEAVCKPGSMKEIQAGVRAFVCLQSLPGVGDVVYGAMVNNTHFFATTFVEPSATAAKIAQLEDALIAQLQLEPFPKT